ncbi:MAG TPA: acetylglutamate kinase [Terriglobia bacterium]|nr:acetylglutamate kinase [Terriglobia bacterium]
MTLVIKIGGEAVEAPRQRRNLARQIAELHQRGHQVVVVHGGGKLLTATLERLGIPTRFHRGLRVTDAATRDVAVMVLAGIVNKQWVAELQQQGVPALGISGGDAGLIAARKLRLGARDRSGKLGFVGRPRSVDTRILKVAFRERIVPVVASVALGPQGEYLNVNADEFASAIAVALRADRLFYLTEAGGVWDADRHLLPVVRLSEIPELIEAGVVRDGMIPKLESCADTLRQSVGEIDILSPDVPNVLVQALEKVVRGGTRIVKAA